MPRFISPDGELTIETAVATEAAELRRDGWAEQRARTAAVREADGVKSEPAKPAADTAASPKSTK